MFDQKPMHQKEIVMCLSIIIIIIIILTTVGHNTGTSAVCQHHHYLPAFIGLDLQLPQPFRLFILRNICSSLLLLLSLYKALATWL